MNRARPELDGERNDRGSRQPETRAPHLLILTQYFPPEMGAPQVRLSELGNRLAARGWSVEALTALPNYPTGRVFPGYRRLRATDEQIGSIRTVRVPIWPARRGFLRRLACYFSFVASSSLLGPGRCTRPDLIWVESPPLFIGYAARYLSRRWNCPFALNVSDLWPESAIRMGMLKPGPATRYAERLELSLYEQAAGITGQSEEIIDSITSRISGTPTRVITNGVDPNRFDCSNRRPSAAALLGEDAGPIFIYAGLLGHAQGLDQILTLARNLAAETPGRFVLVGDGPRREELVRQIRDDQISRVRLLPPQPRSEIPDLLAAADCAIISLGSMLPGAVPSKIYEAMAACLPILLIAGGEAARRVDTARAGISVAPGDATGLRAAFLRLVGEPDLRKRLGSNGRTAAETVYNRDRIAGDLDTFLRGVLDH